MDSSNFATVLWIAALVVLVLYLIRRNRRKRSSHS